MKRKVLTCMVVGSLAVALGTASAFATSAKTGNRYEDTNADGICDNYNECPRLADDKAEENRTCLKDGTGKRAGKRCRLQKAEFVDENDDGICDNRGDNAGNGRERGCGRGRNR